MIARSIQQYQSLKTNLPTHEVRGLASNREVADLLVRASWDCFQRGRPADAERLLRSALSTREKKLGLNHRRLIPVLNHLGMVLGAQGRDLEAEEFFLRALEIAARKDRVPTYEIDVMESYSRLLRKLGRGSEAAIVDEYLQEARKQQRTIHLLKLNRALTSSRNVSDIKRVYGNQITAASNKLMMQRIAIVAIFIVLCVIWLVSLR